ncbi:MAG: hypothetical protein ACOCQN_00085 [Halanaerobiaceae bacterium]
MSSIKKIKTLWEIDRRSIWRDDLLSWIIGMPIGVSLLLRWGLPYILRAIGDYTNQDIINHYSILTGFFILLIVPMVSGMIAGFLLLEQRDNNTLTVLKITPMSPVIYMVYSLLMPVLSCILITVISFYLAGLGNLGIGIILVSSLSAAPLAPLSAMLMASFAENKVQGFALVKGTIVFWVPPILVYFLRPAWEFVFGLIPLYWPCRVY